jgi:hypothetical protein
MIFLGGEIIPKDRFLFADRDADAILITVAQRVISKDVSTFCRPPIPLDSLYFIPIDTNAILITEAQIVLCTSMTLKSSFTVPEMEEGSGR